MIWAILMVRETSVGSMLPKRGTTRLPGNTRLRFAKSTVSSGGIGVFLVLCAKAGGFATGIASNVPLSSEGSTSVTTLLTILL